MLAVVPNLHLLTGSKLSLTATVRCGRLNFRWDVSVCALAIRPLKRGGMPHHVAPVGFVRLEAGRGQAVILDLAALGGNGPCRSTGGECNMLKTRGRPKPRSFSGLFLPNMEWEFRVQEIPMRALEEDPVFGTPMRHLRRKSGGPPAGVLLRQFKTAFEKHPAPEARSRFVAAFDGDPNAVAEIESMRPWEVYCLGQGSLPYSAEYARIEKLCLAADKALFAGDYRSAATAVSLQPELRLFWRDEALDALAGAATLAETVPARLAAYLELQMSCLAKVSQIGEDASPVTWTDGEFFPVVQPDGQPGRHYMRNCMQIARVKSQGAFLAVIGDFAHSNDRLPETATLKRWCSGKVFPPLASISPVGRALLELVRARENSSIAAGSEPERCPGRLFSAARRTNAALEIAKLLVKSPAGAVLLGSEDAGKWAADSYQRWVKHWRDSPASG